ncbi:MAG: diacylglycerol kinase family protein [Bacillota bacterium]|jgi:diacylglycerol kinase (ATP)
MKKASSFRESFGYACRGLLHCLRHERNFRVHLVMGCAAFLLGAVLGLSGTELAVLSLLVAFVLFAEMINTALENLVDLFTREYHPLAAVVKDVAAGAVLIVCVIAVVIGVLLFAPHLAELLQINL